jgi:hypothetical protein
MLGGFSDEAFSWMTAALLLLLVMAGGVMGTGAVLRVSPAVLSEWPPPLLAGLGFLLGAVIVVVGAIRLFFRVLLCVANLLGAWPH